MQLTFGFLVAQNFFEEFSSSLHLVRPYELHSSSTLPSMSRLHLHPFNLKICVILLKKQLYWFEDLKGTRMSQLLITKGTFIP